MKKKNLITGFLVLSFLLHLNMVFADAPAQNETFQKLNGEIIDIEELKDPPGSAVYTVRDLSSGKVVRLFVNPYRSLIQMGGKIVAAGDPLGGSKAVFMFQQVSDREMPEVVFARVSSNY